MAKQQYKFKTGIWKSIKNVAIVMGIPALVLLLDNWANWIPNEWHTTAGPIIAFLAYLVKNYIQNK